MFTVVEFDSGFINMTVIALQNWTEKVYSEVKLALLISFVCVACSKKQRFCYSYTDATCITDAYT